MCKINVIETGTGTSATTKDTNVTYCNEYDLSSYSQFQLDPEKGPICTTEKTLPQPLQFTKYKDYVGLRYNKECLSYHLHQDSKPSDIEESHLVPCENFSTLGLFRSVYFHKGNLIAFAPPKSYNLIALQLSQHITTTSFDIEHFADGTLIMLAHNGEEWVKFTRSYVGAGNSFFKGQKSFACMFDEACDNIGLDVETLDPTYCYSFVLQHKENRIVSEIFNNTLCLVGVYECNGLKVKELRIQDNPHIQTMFRSTKVVTNMLVEKFHQIIHDTRKQVNKRQVSLYDVLHHFINIYASNQTTHSIQGIVIRIQGKRFKLWNPNYRYVRTLKGNQPNCQFQYYELRKNNMVQEYLRYYPEDTVYFQCLENDIQNFAKRTQNTYYHVFIKKMMNVDDPSISISIKKQLKPLHRYYLEFLRPWRKVVSIQEVVHFIGSLSSPQLMDIMSNKKNNTTTSLKVK